jgi:hypothetical protein
MRIRLEQRNFCPALLSFGVAPGGTFRRAGAQQMEPKSFGKKLGIGMRVAGNIARDRAQESARRREASPPAAASGTATRPANPQPSVAQVISQNSEKVARRGRDLGRGLGRGSRQFGQSFFRPFAHASSVLWLEITGCFFALFAAFFAQNVYRARAQYAAGPDHRNFLLYCVLTLLFAYFSASSFIKARRRSRRQAAGK